jgi:sugar lactone lactonase YvrE
MKSSIARKLLLAWAAFALLPLAQAQSDYATPYAFTTLAGSPKIRSIDGPGNVAIFIAPSGAATDNAGNIYVAENHTIRKVTPAGVVTTLAGLAGSPGSVDGTGSAARFNAPIGVAVDSAGNTYVADSENHTIRKITAAGVVTTFAGAAGISGSDDGTGAAARFSKPTGVAVDNAGNIYVVEYSNCTIRKITAAGLVTTLAGTAGNPGSDNYRGSAAKFYYPRGVAVDKAGNVYVADTGNTKIRKITPTGDVTTFAGGGYGSADGTGSNAQFFRPEGVAVDGTGNVYVADTGNQTVRKITPAGVVTTVAGTPMAIGFENGTGSGAKFNSPAGIAVDTTGNVYVADTFNGLIRKITSAATVTTLAGSVVSSKGSTDGTSSVARFNFPAGVAVDGTNNVYVADTWNHTIRKISAAGVVTTLAGSAGNPGSTDGTGNTARFYSPCGLALDKAGNIYVADTYNCTIRKVTPAGVVTTFAGVAGSYGSANGTGSEARFDSPRGIAVDSAGIVYVADYSQTIRKITAAGVVTTLAGSAGERGSADGTGSDARFYSPSGIAVDNAGNIYVADRDNYTIRKITSSGVVTTVAGSPGSSGSADGTGSDARFLSTDGIAVDGTGNIYVTDKGFHTIRKITSSGATTTIAGGYGNADGSGSAAKFDEPEGIAVDGAGVVYVADSYNSTIRVGIPAAPPVITSASTANATVGSAFSYQVAATNSPTSFTATGLPAGLSINATTGLISGSPTTAGSSSVTLTATNDLGSSSPLELNLSIAKGSATVTLSKLTATYDGISKSVTVATSPPGLSVSIKYNGNASAPADLGSYSVEATVNDANYTGSASGTLTITSSSSSSSSSSSGSSSGGGGGAPGDWFVFSLVAIAAVRVAQKRFR